MPQWEYCEVAWTPQQIIIHMYRDRGMWYEGAQQPEAWGALLAQLGDDEWEMVSAVPTNTTGHTLYYFKRPLDKTTLKTPDTVKMEEDERIREQSRERARVRAQIAAQTKAAVDKGAEQSPSRQTQPLVNPVPAVPATVPPQEEQPLIEENTPPAVTPSQEEQPLTKENAPPQEEEPKTDPLPNG
ncbi:MAG TPA: hypothetical protein VKR06_17290 [Ktedonosporobacter sp.]|nr:hypothetical protein [Ktedonosporobacter sp.]